MPAQAHGFKSSDIHDKIRLLIDGLVNIKDKSGEFLMTLADGRVIDTKGWNDWEWTHGIGLNGIWAYYSLTGDEKYLKIIEDWFANRFAAGGTTKNINTMAVFLTLAYVYEKTGNITYLPWLDSWAEWAYHDLERTKYGGMQHITYLEENDQQLWDDTLMMTVMPLAKIGEAARPAALHRGGEAAVPAAHQVPVRRQDGPVLPRVDVPRGRAQLRPTQGGRGQRVAHHRHPDFLELLDFAPNDPIRIHLLDTLNAQCDALRDHPEEEGSYLEASATAGFAFGILKAQRKKYIGKEHEEVALKAIKAVLDNIDADGELLNTSFGTGMGRDLQHYKDIPITSMPPSHGSLVDGLTNTVFVQHNCRVPSISSQVTIGHGRITSKLGLGLNGYRREVDFRADPTTWGCRGALSNAGSTTDNEAPARKPFVPQLNPLSTPSAARHWPAIIWVSAYMKSSRHGIASGRRLIDEPFTS
ncbi:hypothetical protein NUW58_g5887 [Xylaria curta]|uniref:Uncharacterized protein n=1 Tax=Xylaria curta TaxID=42375 RepID=A0ACC1NZH2_9PEZI|nr:hypothetical protein NUW58_g5887 [Xylaria curta]